MSDQLVVHRPPTKKIHSLDYTRFRIYLSGSSTGFDWQDRFISTLTNLPVDVFTPLHPIHATPHSQAFEWEMDHMSIANVIAFYFSPDDLCASALLSLGMYANTDKIIVCCPEGYQRKQDVDALCHREDIMQVDCLDTLISATTSRISSQAEIDYTDVLVQMP